MFLSNIYISVKKIFLDTPKEPVISKVAERKMSPTEEEDEDSEKVTEKKRVDESSNKRLSISYFFILSYLKTVFFAGNKNSCKIKVEERKIHK